MIKSLKRKFISISMLSMSLVIIIIVLILNISNYTSIISESDKTLDMLIATNCTFPDEYSSSTEKNEFYKDVPFESRFFYVKYDQDENVIKVDLQRTTYIKRSTALEYAKNVRENSTDHGFLNNYRYAVHQYDNNHTMVIFLDCQRLLQGSVTLLISSLIYSIVGLISVFILIVFFSSIVFKPVEESYIRQKQFITNANHELKTPLTIISTTTDVIEMTSGKTEWTEDIKRQVSKLTDLTNELVFLSRLDEEGTTISRLEFSISEVLLDSIKEYELPLKTRNISVKTSINGNVTYNGDMAKIKSLFVILLDNINKYALDNSEVEVSLKDNEKNRLEIIFTNQTNGVPQGNLNILFERFYRLDSSRNSSLGGSGIGLSIAQAIVSLHKGTITCESKDGKEIKFIINLK